MSNRSLLSHMEKLSVAHVEPFGLKSNAFTNLAILPAVINRDKSFEVSGMHTVV
jgi:hypothetical protein